MTLLLDSVTLTYPDGEGRLTALDAVSVSAEPGELVGVVGPSGSGKSSLLAVAATLIRPDSGRVVVGGRDVSELSLAALATVRRRHVGIVFQQPNLLPSLTVREQLEVVTRLGAGSRDSTTRAGERADELLEAVGLAAFARRRPHQLSGGQRQRVSIARALMGAPEVLLVDEPTSALDHSRGAEVVGLLRRLTTELGTATLLVTHEVEHLASADRVVEVRDGRVRSAAQASRA